MQRCLQLARLGLGTTRPNPSVGCVITYNNKIIGEGFTSPYGSNHAEVNAINTVSDKSLLKNSRLYVTLEPCSHHGKTPPCSDLIIKHKIPEVFIGTVDMHSKVSGEGIKKLRAAGCYVHVGILEDDCKKQHKRFLTYHSKQRPYIILKWAQSADGFIAPLKKNTRKPVWISNRYSRQLTHKWRSEEQAILIGAQTVIDDNPTLTTRHWFGSNPTRILIDPNNRVSKSSIVFNADSKTILLPEANTISKSVLDEVIMKLHQKKINSVIIEGGTKTINHFIEADLWDEARMFTSEVILDTGISAPKILKEYSEKHRIASDTLFIYENH